MIILSWLADLKPAIPPAQGCVSACSDNCIRDIHNSLSPICSVAVWIQMTASAALGLSRLTAQNGLVQSLAQCLARLLAQLGVVLCASYAHLGDMTYISAFLLSGWRYWHFFHVYQSGHPLSLLSTGWQHSLLHRLQLLLCYLGSHSRSCLLLLELTSATQPWSGLSPQICTLFFILFEVGSS